MSESQLEPVERHLYWEPEGFVPPPAKGNHWIDENEHYVLQDLLDLERWGSKNSKDLHTWGFTVYNAASDSERFHGGIAKLTLCIRYWATQQRYSGLEPTEDCTQLVARPTTGKMLPSHDLARRFEFDIVEDYPGKDTVIAGGEDGDEDFMAIGRDFTQRVERDALGTSNLYVRNDHCLIIDDKSLRTLEALPDQYPPPGPDYEAVEEGTACFLRSPQADAWVWMLDREYYKKYAHAKEAGGDAFSLLHPQGHPEERRFEPWVRTHIGSLPRVWFFRPRGMSPPVWESVVQRDRHKFDLVNWWGDAQANTANDILRRSRRGEPVFGMFGL
ncbi:hypothetical protein ACO1O0_005137 [Amphichorda felina]